MGEYGILDMISDDSNQALKKIEKLNEQFSSHMNCSYWTTIRTDPIPRDRLSSELKNKRKQKEIIIWAVPPTWKRK